MPSLNLIIPEKKVIVPDDLPAIISQSYPLPVFDPLIIDFLDSLSKSILKNNELNRNPGFAALGFWLRKANINLIINENNFLVNSNKFVLNPLGVVLHICPANVDTMFLYSLSLSLLTGNKNIVRISSRIDNYLINILFDCIESLINQDKYNILRNYLNIVQYEHNDEINTFLSHNVNARIIWGGDTTVSYFKTFPTNGRNKDLTFPDRTSYCIFKASGFNFLEDEKKKEVVRIFYNDSFSFDQQGCSSPQIIFVTGNYEDYEYFKKNFYNLLKIYANDHYKNDIFSLATYKYNQLAIDVLENKLHINDILKESNFVYFIEISDQSEDISSCGGGYFYIKYLETVNELEHFINKNTQTLSYFGLSQYEIDQIVNISFGKGIDRVVPVGEALNFEYIWDGYNIIDELCLKKRVK